MSEKVKYYSDRTRYSIWRQQLQSDVNHGYISTEQAQAYLDEDCEREGIDMENVKDMVKKFKKEN